MSALLPGITIIENVADWTVPDDIDISTYTFGTDYIHFMARRDGSNATNQLNKQGFPGGFHIAVPLAEFNEIIQLEGYPRFNTREHANLFKRFFIRHRRVTDPLSYIIIKHNVGATGIYTEFGDPRNVMREYAPGYISSLDLQFDASAREFSVRGVFDVAWVT